MERLSHIAISEEGLIFGPLAGDRYMVNPSGRFILRNLLSEKSEQNVAEKMAEEFGISETEALMDLKDFLGQLRLYNLV